MKELLSIIEYLQNRSEISAVWLFGSFATGKNRFDSDLDLAVLFIPELTKKDKFNIRLSLVCELSEIAHRDVDIIDMQSAPLFLQHQIRKSGRLLFEKDPVYRKKHDVQSRQEYFDFAHMLELRNKKLIKKL